MPSHSELPAEPNAPDTKVIFTDVYFVVSGLTALADFIRTLKMTNDSFTANL
jgi:hypothetical protein